MFNLKEKNLFLIFGNTDDQVCQQDLSLVDFDVALLTKLKGLSYERVAFFSGLDRLKFLDEESYHSYQRQLDGVNQPANPTVGPQGIVAGPFGTVATAIDVGGVKADSGKDCACKKNKMPKSIRVSSHGLPSFVDGFISNAEYPSVLIFNSLSFLSTMQSTQRALLTDVFEKLIRDSQNQNRIIFCFQGSPLRIRQELSQDSIRDFSRFFYDGEQLGDNCIEITRPGLGEYMRLFQRQRLLNSERLLSVSSLLEVQDKYTGISGSETSSDSGFYLKAQLECIGDQREVETTLANHNVDILFDRDVLGAGIEQSVQGLDRFDNSIQNIRYFRRHLSDVFAELNSLIGLSSVKTEMKKVSDSVLADRLLGASTKTMPSHFAFYGPPGTGKTTVARIVADMLLELGILTNGNLVEAKASSLVGEYRGQAEQNTIAVCQRADGGVLFIDEAHQLFDRTEGAYGQKVIETLVPIMENNRSSMVVILAGYKEALESMIEQDDGLHGRIKTHINFESFSADECRRIFELYAGKDKWEISSELLEQLDQIFNLVINGMGSKFANARTVRNIYEAAVTHLKSRLIANGSEISADSRVLLLEDVPEQYRPKPVDENGLENALSELNSLVGLGSVKSVIEEYVISVKADARLGLKGQTVPSHFAFYGGPGTGKTTVARLLGDILCYLEVLPTPNLVETRPSNLVGQYHGHAESNTEEVCKKAVGGILFVDEAHQLTSGGEGTFGIRVLETLVPIMENSRSSMSVILAGYEGSLKRLLSQDQGLHSRIKHHVYFQDYTAIECARMFALLAAKDHRLLAESLEQTLPKIFERAIYFMGENFSNGRSVRNIYEKAVSSLKRRIVEVDISDPVFLTTIILEDIPDVGV